MQQNCGLLTILSICVALVGTLTCGAVVRTVDTLSSENTPLTLTTYKIKIGKNKRVTVISSVELKLTDGPYGPVVPKNSLGQLGHLDYAELSSDRKYLLCHWDLVKSAVPEFTELTRVFDLKEKRAVCNIQFRAGESLDNTGAVQ